MLARFLTTWRTETRGAAAVEMALVVLLLLLPILNLVDFGVYAYSRMQVENAAQMGAQWGWSSCNSNTPGETPALNSSKCPGFENAVSSGITNTTLKSGVTMVANYPTEGYYCSTTSNTLVLVGTAGKTTGGTGTPPSGEPATCAGVAGAANPNGVPGDYIQVSVTYTYSPLFYGDIARLDLSLRPSPRRSGRGSTDHETIEVAVAKSGRRERGGVRAGRAPVRHPDLRHDQYQHGPLGRGGVALHRGRRRALPGGLDPETCDNAADTETWATNHYVGPRINPTFTIVASSTCPAEVEGSATFVIHAVLVNVSVPLTAKTCFPNQFT